MSGVLKQITEPEKKLDKPKSTPCAEKTDTIHESLRKIKEQIEAIPILDLTSIQQQLDDIKTSIDIFITIMRERVDLDEKEEHLMDLLQKRLEKGI